MPTMPNELLESIDRIGTQALTLLTERNKAVSCLKDIEDYVGDRCDGAPDAHDPLHHVWVLTQDYALGNVPSPSSHTPCEQANARAIERAVMAEENERHLRDALAALVLRFAPKDDADVTVMRLACAALRRPGRHAGPYTVPTAPTARALDRLEDC
jgi:hypothetical protein